MGARSIIWLQGQHALQQWSDPKKAWTATAVAGEDRNFSGRENSLGGGRSKNCAVLLQVTHAARLLSRATHLLPSPLLGSTRLLSCATCQLFQT